MSSFGKKSSTPRPPPKKISKNLFHLYWWCFKQWNQRKKEKKGGRQGGHCLSYCSAGAGLLRTVLLSSTKQIYFSISQEWTFQSVGIRGWPLQTAIASPSHWTTPKLFSFLQRQHSRGKVKLLNSDLRPSLVMLLTLPKATGGLKNKIERFWYFPFEFLFWLQNGERYHYFRRNVDRYSRLHTSHIHLQVTPALQNTPVHAD